MSKQTIMAIVVGAAAGLMITYILGPRDAKGFEISEQVAKMAIVKAITLGYMCRDQGVPLGDCIVTSAQEVRGGR